MHLHLSVTAIYLAGDSYPLDRGLEVQTTEFLTAKLGIYTHTQSSLIPTCAQSGQHAFDPAVRHQMLSLLIDSNKKPVVLLGRSSGARIITQYAANNPYKIASCICFAYPFQAPGSPPEDWRTIHLKTLKTPTLIIQGNRDRYGHKDLQQRFEISPYTKILVVDGDHESEYKAEDWKRICCEIEKMIRITTKKVDVS